MAGEFLPALIDKDSMLIGRLRIYAVFGDIELEELGGFLLDLYEAEPVSFAQDGQCLLLGVEVIQVERGDFTGSGP